MEEGFAESAIVATVWLIQHAPERLERWLKLRGKHGDTLERLARQRIADAKTKSSVTA